MKTTASGLQYGVLQPGRAAPGPTADDMVEVHYTGWLTDGTKFDSSRDRGEPAERASHERPFPSGSARLQGTDGRPG